MAAGQRYCVGCGGRSSGHRVEPGPVLEAIATASLAAVMAGDPPIGPVADATAAEAVAGGSGASPLVQAVASKSAAGTGLALLAVGMIAGAAFSPPAAETLAAQQRVVIVQAPGAPVQGPAPIEPAAADPVADEPAPEPTPQPVPEEQDPAPPPQQPDPDPVPLDPSIKHFALLMLPGGAAEHRFTSRSKRAASQGSARSPRKHATAAAAAAPAVTWATALAPLAAGGVTLKGFKQSWQSGFANRIALLTAREPTDEMKDGCEITVPPLSDPKAPKPTGCIAATTQSENLASVLGSSAVSLGDAVRVYVDAPAEVGVAALCKAPVPGDPFLAPADGTPPSVDNPLLWIDPINRDPGLCFDADKGKGAIRLLSRLAADLEAAAEADAASPFEPSHFPPLVMIVPSRCRTDASVRCPDGSEGGPAALKALVDGVLVKSLLPAKSFAEDGALFTAWDRPAAGSSEATGAIVSSKLAAQGRTVATPYDTYGLSATLQLRLGTADGQGLPLLGLSAKAKPFGRDVFPAR